MKNLCLLVILIASATFCSVNRGPILSTEVPHESMVVNFVTDNPCIGEVKYREIEETSWHIRGDASATTNHAIFLLTFPYSNYEYILLADGDSIGPYSFWTAPEPGAMEDFQFCAYGDSRDWHVFHSEIIAHMETCDPMFVTNSGDMVGDGDVDSDWDTYFELLCETDDLNCKVPFFYAMGNHDDESPYFYDAVCLPQNPSGTEEYSSFDWGRIHFVSINSEIDYSVTSNQYEFLSNDLAAADANPNYDFVIGLVHRPFYSSGYHGREEDMAVVLEPLLIANHVDIVIQGHDHMYERSHPQDGVIYIVTGGGGAPSSPIFYWLPHSAFGYNLFHHLNFFYSADEHKLSMFMHNYSNDIVDSLILVNDPVAIEENKLPKNAKITGYPNPFNSYCRICRPEEIRKDSYIKIYDITGSIVRLEHVGTDCCFDWWGDDNEGNSLPSGVYLAKFVPGTEDAFTITLLK